MMTVLDAFAGIGGFSLGLERTGGFKTVRFIESDAYCRSVLRRHWPSVPINEDVRVFDGPGADIITAGWPCTQTSVAAAIHGKRKGINGEDSGLVREAIRLVRNLRPAWFIGENPPGIKVSASEITAGLENAGYRVSGAELKASDFGVPHQRRRCFFIAHVDGTRLEVARSFLARPPVEAAWPAPPGGLWREDQPGVWRMDDGLPGRLDRIRALGNAVVPQITELIGRAILAAEAA